MGRPAILSPRAAVYIYVGGLPIVLRSGSAMLTLTLISLAIRGPTLPDSSGVEFVVIRNGRAAGRFNNICGMGVCSQLSSLFSYVPPFLPLVMTRPSSHDTDLSVRKNKNSTNAS